MGRKFYRGLKALAAKLGCQPQDLLAVIYLESACKPAALNKTTSAVGLIQFLPSTLRGLGYTAGVYQFQTLSAWEQLPWIERYLVGVSNAYGPLTDAIRLYLAVLYPAALSNPSRVVFAAGSIEYQQNRGLDLDADGMITVDDIARKFEIITAQTDFDSLVGEMMFENPVYAPDVIAEIALRYIDVGAGLDSERYLKVMCGPGDDNASRRYMMAGPSTCALFARGVWRLAGVESGILTSKYQVGQAVADVVAIAKAHNAWHPTPSELNKGDVVLITSPEHVIVCISDPRSTGPASFDIDTCEGGQAPNSSYVRRFTRSVTRRDGKLWFGSRYVVGRADACEMLPAPPHG